MRRLWLNSMTKKAIVDAFARLRPGEEMESLEAAARSRSEADWVVGMNATRAATIRLRAAFDGAVSLGRVQTPTLALVARREEEIRAFKPEPYWLVEADFAADDERLYSGRYLGGKRIEEELAAKVVEDCRDQRGEITKLEKKEERERSQLLYDLTSLQRHANTRYGFSAKRTLAAAQKLYEQHKAITYPRTNSRWLSGDMVPEIRPTAELVGRNREYAKGAAYVTALKELPLGRVVNDKKVEDHHAIIPTKSEHDLSKMREDEKKIYDLVARRFLAIFHPEAVFERTRIETTVAEHVFRTSGRVLLEAGWRSVYGQEPDSPDKPEDDSGGDQLLPKLELGEDVETRRVESLRKETQPPRRFTEASLLGAMETAGKDIDDVELREAMKDSGIGTPATRASIIERLIAVEYIEREGRALHATEKGIQVIRLLGEHQLTSPELTGQWERRLGLIAQGEESRPSFMNDIATLHQGDGRAARRAQGREDRARQPRALPGLRQGREREPQGLLVLVEGRPGLWVRRVEEEGRQEPARLRREGADGKPEGIDRARRRPAVRPDREAGHGLQGPFRAHVPRQAEDRARGGRQVAGGLRRGVGHGCPRAEPEAGRAGDRRAEEPAAARWPSHAELAASVLDEHARGGLANELLDLLPVVAATAGEIPRALALGRFASPAR